MGNHRILIVDDEESVLTVLKDGLRMMENYEVATASDGSSALEMLRQVPFDLIVTDYKMAGMDGLKLLETVKSIQPSTKVILMTAYGTDEIQAEAIRLQACQYLEKPVEMNTFQNVIEATLGNIAISRPGIVILSDENYRHVVNLLKALKDDVSARCSFLADSDGHVIAHVGATGDLPLEQLASLLGGGMATLNESGRMFDDDEDSINLAYREGKGDCLYSINVGDRLLLILVIHNSPYATRIGSVWYYAQQTATKIRQIVGDASFANPSRVFGETSEEELEYQLDNLFPAEESTDKVEKEGLKAGSGESSSRDADADKDTTLTFDEAVKAGLIRRSSNGIEQKPPN
jgi:CheY-like chemotaxis protein